MYPEISLGLMCFFNRFGNALNRTGEIIQGGMNGFEARSNALEELCLLIVMRMILGGAHEDCFGDVPNLEWAQEAGGLASDL